MDDELLASHVDAIYGTSRDGFTAERDRRVKELRSAGHRDEAGALRERRKPTVPAWAVDQLARQDPDTVGELIAAADDLRDAQRRAASGRGSDGLREASRRVRDLTRQLREQAREVIERTGGRADTHLDDVEQTLFTAAVEPDHHEALRRGWFAAALGGSGFGGLGGLVAVPDDAPEGDEGGGDHTAPATPTSEDPELERRQQEEERRQAEARRRARRREELEQRQAQLQRSRERQQRRLDRATSEAEELRSRAAAAQVDADEEAAELARIDEDLESLGEELAGLEP